MKKTKRIKANQINDVETSLKYLQKVLKWQEFCASHKSLAKAIKILLDNYNK